MNVKCLTVATKAGVGKLADMAGQQRTTDQLEEILNAFAKAVTVEEENLTVLIPNTRSTCFREKSKASPGNTFD